MRCPHAGRLSFVPHSNGCTIDSAGEFRQFVPPWCHSYTVPLDQLIGFVFNETQSEVCVAHKHVKEMQALVEHLGKHQLKLTRQRELILNAFLRQEHITAEAMYHQLADRKSTRLNSSHIPLSR